MIFDAIVGVLLGLVEGVLGLIPAWNPPNLAAFATTVGNSVSTANTIFPVTTLGACLLVVIGFKLLLNLVDLVGFVYAKIPFKAT